MGKQLVIDIPSSVATCYVVATNDLVHNTDQFLRNLLRPDSAVSPLASEARQLIGSPALRINSLPATDSSWRDELSRVPVVDDEEQEWLLTAKRHLVLENDAPPFKQPRLAQQTRAVARELAHATNGLLFDTCSVQLIRPDRRVDGERSWFCLADRWLGTDVLINPGAAATSSVTECSCLCIFTNGLARFGLPDLVIDQVACAYDLAATNLLRGLAVHLLALLWKASGAHELEVAKSNVVTPEHMWGYWGAMPIFGGSVPIDLVEARRADLPDGRHLELLPHHDFAGTRVEWGKEVLDKGLPSIAGWQPDDPPYRIDHP